MQDGPRACAPARPRLIPSHSLTVIVMAEVLLSSRAVGRAVAARINVVAMSRGDVQLATKEASRDMAGPNWRAWERLACLV